MARLVLLEVDDDAVAESLLARMGVLEAKGVHIRGLFAMPRSFCKCTKVKGRGWTRGTRLGWWVCNMCRRPSRAWGTSAQAVVGQAVNLLEGKQQELASPLPPAL